MQSLVSPRLPDRLAVKNLRRLIKLSARNKIMHNGGCALAARSSFLSWGWRRA